MLNVSLNIYSILPEIYIICSCLLILLVGVLLNTSDSYGYLLINVNIQYLFFQILILSFILSWDQIFIYATTWNNLLIHNFFSYYSKIIMIFLFILWYGIVSNCVNKEKILNFEFWIFILLNLTSILLLLQIYDLLSTYILIEFQSLIFYILASFKRNSEFSTEAGIKYFILGALSSGLLLFGFSILYNVTGLTNFNELHYFFFNKTYIIHFEIIQVTLLSITFILIALLFKLSAAPFHIWAPDVYEGSPSAITAFFSLMPKLVIISILLKLSILVFYDFYDFWYYIFLFCVLISSLVGTFLAFQQKKWKRFIVYSSINHISFFLLFFLTVSSESLSNLCIYLFIYLIMTLGFFSFFVNFYSFKFPFSYQIRFFTDTSLLMLLNPLLAFSYIIIFFSMAGIPPLAGFFAKFFVFCTSIRLEIIILLIVLLLINAISCFYYIRLIKSMYFDYKIPKRFLVMIPFTKNNTFVLGSSITILIFLVFDFEFIYLLANLLSYSFL